MGKVIVRPAKDGGSSTYRANARLYNMQYIEIGVEKTEEEEARSYAKDRLKYSKTIKLTESPSHNCQMTMIGCGSTVLSMLYTIEQVAQILDKVFDSLHTNAILFDIEEHLVPRLKEALKLITIEGIIFEKEYENPTGTPMCMVYVQVEECINEDDEEDDEWDDDEDIW